MVKEQRHDETFVTHGELNDLREKDAQVRILGTIDEIDSLLVDLRRIVEQLEGNK